jgi:hypothetical protein
MHTDFLLFKFCREQYIPNNQEKILTVNHVFKKRGSVFFHTAKGAKDPDYAHGKDYQECACGSLGRVCRGPGRVRRHVGWYDEGFLCRDGRYLGFLGQGYEGLYGGYGRAGLREPDIIDRAAGINVHIPVIPAGTQVDTVHVADVPDGV